MILILTILAMLWLLWLIIKWGGFFMFLAIDRLSKGNRKREVTLSILAAFIIMGIYILIDIYLLK
jgi:hypothetical protein